MKTDRTVLLLTSDSHGGFKLGLMLDTVTLYSRTPTGEMEPYRPRPTEWQQHVNRQYLDGLAKAAALADGDPIIGLHNGDPTHGNKYAEELVTTRAADQVLIACENFRPLLELPNLLAMRMSASTNSHVLGEKTADILIAEMLRRQYRYADIELFDHGLLDIGGAVVDVAHHGPGPGIREWTRGNQARYYLRSLILQEALAGRPVPSLVVRSHFHETVIEQVNVVVGGRRYFSTLIITPSLCGMSGYSQQATRSKHLVTTGLLAVELVNGKVLDIHEWTETVDIRTKQAF